jgi:spore maturation protein CgeB
MNKRILIHNSKKNNNNYHLICSLWQAFFHFKEIETQISNPHSIQLLINNFHPDYIIVLGGEDISLDFIKSYKIKEIKWILWTTEDPFEIKRNQLISQHFDIVFTSDIVSKELYNHPNCHYLPLAAEKSWFYHPVVEQIENLLYDVIFIGTAWPNRIEFLKDLIELLKKNNLKSRFILPTNPYIPSDNLLSLNLCKFERDFRVAPRDLAKLQNYSLFALTLFRDFSGDGNTIPQSSPTNRFYETALAGSGQIVVSKNINVSDFYPDIGKFVFQCKDAEEIVNLIIKTKENPEIRNTAASEIQKYVEENHSYIHRIEKLLSFL